MAFCLKKLGFLFLSLIAVWFAGRAAADISTDPFIQVSSHAELAIAIDRARSYSQRFPNTAVYQSVNGNYAVTLGSLSRSKARQTIDLLKQNRAVPHDTYASKGERFVGMVWPRSAGVAESKSRFVSAEPLTKPVQAKTETFLTGASFVSALHLTEPEPEPSLAAQCNDIGILTAANGGFSTFHSQDDAEFILYEQLCLARLFAIARSTQLVPSHTGQIDPAVTATCRQLGSAMAPVIAALSAADNATATSTATKLIRSSGKSEEDLRFTGRVCLGIGYKTDDANTALGSAILLFAMGEAAYGELIGQHMLQGIGVAKSFEASLPWFVRSVEAFGAGATAIFAVDTDDRARLIAEAVGRLQANNGRATKSALLGTDQ